MRILCDVHISYKICNFFNKKGHHSLHVNQILSRSETKDSEICQYADLNDFIVLTKDIDFKNSFLLRQTPKKLIKVNLGNISNVELQNILEVNIDLISRLFRNKNFLLEIDINQINCLEI